MAQIQTVSYLDGENGVTNKIKKAMYDVAKQFVYIGFLLWEVQEYGHYREHGFQDVYEYAAHELNLKKTTVKNLIGINKTFGSINVGMPVEQRTMNLQPGYAKFNYSQLTEMLSMSEPQRAKVTPDMSIRKIRELKKENTIDFKALDSIIKKNQTSDQEPEFPLEPEYETTPIEAYTDGQTSDRTLEYSITLDRAEWEIIIDNLEDDIKYNYDDPGKQETMKKIIDEIRGTIKYRKEEG